MLILEFCISRCARADSTSQCNSRGENWLSTSRREGLRSAESSRTYVAAVTVLHAELERDDWERNRLEMLEKLNGKLDIKKLESQSERQ